jgi:hypothetical protein
MFRKAVALLNLFSFKGKFLKGLKNTYVKRLQDVKKMRILKKL